MKISVSVLICFLFSTITLAQTGSGQKIVIIDTGIESNVPFKDLRVIEEYCWSKPDRASLDSGPAPQFNDLEVGSLCKNGGESDFLSPGAATLPRTVRHSSTPSEYATHTFGTNHGTRVFNEALFSAFDARFIIVNSSFYNSENRITFNGIPNTRCRVHGPNGNLQADGTVKPSDNIGCYGIVSIADQVPVINAIRSAGNVAAINYSAGAGVGLIDATSCSRGNNLFSILKNENIAFIAAAGNDGPGAAVGYPACNSNVIAVGGLNFDGTVASYTSTGTDQIEFFANGISLNTGATGTSFAAPKVAAAFAVVQSAEERVRTVDEIKRALTASAQSFVVVNGRNIPVVTTGSATAAAACLIDGSCVSTIATSPNELNYEDGGQHGSIFNGEDTKYDLEFDFDLITPVLPTPSPQNRLLGNSEVGELTQAFQTIGDAVPNERDIVLKFEGRGPTSTGNGINVLINGTVRFSTIFFTNSKSFEFVIPRTMFNTGANIITLQPIQPVFLWGVTNITANFTPVVPLVVNVVDQNIYGSNRNPERPTGMRASFQLESINGDVIVTATGISISSPDEIGVYVNGKFQDNLQAGPDSFRVRKDDLLVGINVVEFVQKLNALGDWSVTDILVTVILDGAIGVMPAIMLLLDDS